MTHGANWEQDLGQVQNGLHDLGEPQSSGPHLTPACVFAARGIKSGGAGPHLACTGLEELCTGKDQPRSLYSIYNLLRTEQM